MTKSTRGREAGAGAEPIRVPNKPDGGHTAHGRLRDDARESVNCVAQDASPTRVRKPLWGQDAMIGLGLLITAAVASVSMFVVHRSHHDPPLSGTHHQTPPSVIPGQQPTVTASITAQPSERRPPSVWRDPGIFWRPSPEGPIPAPHPPFPQLPEFPLPHQPDGH